MPVCLSVCMYVSRYFSAALPPTVHFLPSSQVIVADEDFTSNAVTTYLTIELIDDETPQLTNTSSEQVFTEEWGPVPIVDPTATFVDPDNCPDHRVIVTVRVRLTNPSDTGEDLLVVDGDFYSEGLNFSCDASVNLSCYDDFIRAVRYNNTAEEPQFMSDRIVEIVVGGACSSSSGCTPHCGDCDGWGLQLQQ